MKWKLDDWNPLFETWEIKIKMRVNLKVGVEIGSLTYLVNRLDSGLGLLLDLFR